MITWFKELLFLISVLFDRTDKVETAVVKKMNYFPFSGYKYMAWCGYILTTKEKYMEISENSLNHETIHLKQAQNYKRFYSYYLRYLWEWMKGNPIIYPSSSAYYTIPYEVEAYGFEYEIGYNPTKDTLKNFDIKNRKKTYKTNIQNWKHWCRMNYGDLKKKYIV